MLLVVTLTVRRDTIDAFRRYEREAARIMRTHGGAIERAVVLRAGTGDDPALAQEVHIVRFPDDAAYAAYRADPRIHALAPLRDASIVETRIRVGDDGPDYRS